MAAMTSPWPARISVCLRDGVAGLNIGRQTTSPCPDPSTATPATKPKNYESSLARIAVSAVSRPVEAAADV